MGKKEEHTTIRPGGVKPLPLEVQLISGKTPRKIIKILTLIQRFANGAPVTVGGVCQLLELFRDLPQGLKKALREADTEQGFNAGKEAKSGI